MNYVGYLEVYAVPFNWALIGLFQSLFPIWLPSIRIAQIRDTDMGIIKRGCFKFSAKEIFSPRNPLSSIDLKMSDE